MTLVRTVKEDLKSIDLRLLGVCAFACLLIVSYRYYIAAPILKLGYIDQLFGNAERNHILLYRHMTWHFSSLIFMLLLPFGVMVLINRFSGRKLSPAGYTFSLGDIGTGLKLVSLFVSIFVGILLLLAIFKPSHFDPYPMCHSNLILSDIRFFVLFQLGQCFYMFGFEYFFRGFVLFEAERVFGFNAIGFTLIPYIIIKIGRGPLEIYTAILVGIFLAYTALKARSYIYPALAHSAIAVANDVITLVIKT